MEELAPVVTPRRSVAELARTVDRQLECVRSILASVDPSLGQGTLGAFVRSTAVEMAAAGQRVAPTPGTPAAQAAVAAVAATRCLMAITSLAARAFPAWDGFDELDRPPGLDVLDVLAEDVLDRYRLLPPAWAEPAPDPATVAIAARGCLNQRIPVDLYLRQLEVTNAGVDARVAVALLQAAIAWVAIDGQITETAAWLLVSADAPAAPRVADDQLRLGVA